MKTSQALIAIGGGAHRLRVSGIKVGVSKAFMQVGGKPILYWNLLSLHDAGIRRLVLCGNKRRQLWDARQVIKSLDRDGLARFDGVKYFRDPGLGVHGLPYQARRYLDETFIFECGHSLMQPDHYRRMDSLKEPGSVVFSAFEPHPSNRRQPVILDGEKIRLLEQGKSAFAHPFLLDREYAEELPTLDFNIDAILAYYVTKSLLRYVVSAMPPEFDVADEYTAAVPKYEVHAIALRLTGSGATAWR